MKQILLFPKNAYLTRLTAVEDMSLQSINKMDEIQRYELGKAIFWVTDIWIDDLKLMNINSVNITHYEMALLDISENWIREMVNLLSQLDNTQIASFKENNNNQIEIPWLEDILTPFDFGIEIPKNLEIK